MTMKKSISARLQETLSIATVPSLRISVPALSIDMPNDRCTQTEAAKRREMLSKCRGDLERFMRDERQRRSVSKSAA